MPFVYGYSAPFLLHFTTYLSWSSKKIQIYLDVYLLGTVMLVFGMGLYELFISNLDKAKSSQDGSITYRSNLFGLFTLKVRLFSSEIISFYTLSNHYIWSWWSRVSWYESGTTAMAGNKDGKRAENEARACDRDASAHRVLRQE